MAVDVASLLEDHRVHARVYTDSEVFAVEVERIWSRTWVYVGHESEVPRPGDHVARLIGVQPVAVRRDDDGSVRVTLPGSAPVPRMGTYRGFVFASLTGEGESLEEHLGAAADYVDHFVDMAPAGEVRLGAGVVRHLVMGNWKMPVENATDGYHPVFLHQSCIREFRAEGANHAEALGSHPTVFTRDLGGGHGMLDFSEQNHQTGSILDFDQGRLGDEARAEYRAALEAAHGAQRASELLSRGLSNLSVFPNLVLAFQEVRTFVPRGVGCTELLHFPALLEGAPEEINRARIRSNVLMFGSAGFLGPDDAEIYDRNQRALDAPGWLQLRRGIEREETEADGTLVAQASDETSQRAFWRHYRHLMAA